MHTLKTLTTYYSTKINICTIKDSIQRRNARIKVHHSMEIMAGKISDLVGVDASRTRSDLETQLNEAGVATETLPVVRQKILGAGVCSHLR